MGQSEGKQQQKATPSKTIFSSQTVSLMVTFIIKWFCFIFFLPILDFHEGN